jgi:SAM-dependent methyltransferase
MSNQQSLDAAYFDRVYAGSSDPWHFATSPYEHGKYDATLAALGDRHFASAFEIGCSIGVLTARLAERCDALLSVDINPKALDAARSRCAALPNVRFAQMTVPREFPDARFDLIVLSEVAYYWSDEDLALARDRIAGSAPGGLLELVHFLPKVEDYVRDGDAVHEAFLNDSRFARVGHARAEHFRIDLLRVS